MKKIIGTFIVVILSVTLFTNTNKNTNNDLSLSSLIAINTAEAESQVRGCEFSYFSICRRYFFDVTNCYNNFYGSTCGI